MQEEGLNEVSFLVEDDDPQKEDKLKSVLEELSNSCNQYVNFTKGVGCGQGLGKTKLDKERMKLCLREIVIISKIAVEFLKKITIYSVFEIQENIGKMARTLKAIVTKNSFKERYRTALGYLQKIKGLYEDVCENYDNMFFYFYYYATTDRIKYFSATTFLARHFPVDGEQWQESSLSKNPG